MRRKKLMGQEEEDNEINLTPMLDVVFIMLIFFIVTATFVKEVGLDVNQPDDDKPKTVDPDKKSIVVRITSRGCAGARHTNVATNLVHVVALDKGPLAVVKVGAGRCAPNGLPGGDGRPSHEAHVARSLSDAAHPPPRSGVALPVADAVDDRVARFGAAREADPVVAVEIGKGAAGIIACKHVARVDARIA